MTALPPLLPWRDWTNAIATAVASVPDESLRQAAEMILRVDLILTAGNGGSSAIASHAAQAIAKPSYKPGGGRPSYCISDNIPSLTAHANDGGWPDAMVECARPFLDGFQSRCALVAISSSGRSENVCRLAKLAVERGATVITLTGFSGQPLRGFGHIALHIDSDDYEIVETAHQSVVHRVQAHLRNMENIRK